MGFWQGLNEGLTFVIEQKTRKNELEAARQERAAERAADREYQLQDQKAANKLVIDKAMADLISKTSLYDKEAEDVAHELSVLKGLGATEEVLANAATLGKTALQEAVTYAKGMQEKYAGSPLEFGEAGLNAFLSSAVTTVKEGKAPNMAVAAKMFGITPEDMEKEFVGGKTYKDVIAGALTIPATRETTFLGTEGAAPLKLADIETIKTGANNALLDALNQRSITVGREAAGLNTIASDRALTQEETERRTSLNEELASLSTAKDELEKGGVASAINLVGGQALIPFFANSPVAMSYDFGPAWSSATSRYTFADEDALREAANAGRILPGDYVIVNGVAGRVR
jgi:hypothetical protein